MGEAKRKADSIKNKYQYVTNADGSGQAIGITDNGMYDGVIYRYGKVTFGKETTKGNLPFRFEYDILDPVKLNQEDFGDDFFNLIGDILVDIIDEKVETQEIGYNSTND
jgi:hypothetical protein